ncbi:hypothetical protein FQN54_000461 [Arachnomyces sp. PD_36]|nr:hypothetical protein FQN54_000461 [Arachnomyces sp. PD_36]
MATPSSRHNPGATPTQITSSPHPSASVPMARPLSHKSPSHRTPSASGHGPGHPPGSATHQQYSTPLAAMTSMEDNIAFSSPSALLALGALGGITPSPAGNQIHDNDINQIGITGLGIMGPKNVDAEFEKNIRAAASMLEPRNTGRGVCREAVQRVASIDGLECMWQENNLTIAGTSVDLEIEFDDGAETVKQVSLSYVTPDTPEGKRREEASEVIRRDVVQSKEEKEKGEWKKMENFRANLQRLAKLDKLSKGVNCFEAIEGLYESLKQVWEGEKNLPKSGDEWKHLCNGVVGRPALHGGSRIGLGLDYWVRHGKLWGDKAREQPAQAGPSQGAVADEPEVWGVSVDCEEGYPSIRVSKNWVASEPVVTTGAARDSDKTTVNWEDPPPTTISESGDQNAATPNCRFVAKLEPPVDIPVLAAADIYRHLDSPMPQEYKVTTYDGMIVPPQALEKPEREPETVAFEEQQSAAGKQKDRYVDTLDENGDEVQKPHRYTFHPVDHVAGCTIRELPFAHPKQFTEIFPILRQYALLSTLIQGVFGSRKASDKTFPSPKFASPPSQAVSSPVTPQTPTQGTTQLSNTRPTISMLSAILSRPKSPNIVLPEPGDTVYKTEVSVSLRAAGTTPSIILYWRPGLGNPHITIKVEIGLNGRVTIPETSGIWENLSREGGKERIPTTEETGRLHRLLAKGLETTEDLGMLIEYTWMWIDSNVS